MATPNCKYCVVSFRVTCWLFITLLPTWFLLAIFLFSFTSAGMVISFATESSSLEIFTSWCAYCYRCHANLLGLLLSGVWFALISWWILVWFYVESLYCLAGAGSCHDATWNGFCLSGKVVALHLDNSTAQAYLFNQESTVSPFLSRHACQILSPTDKHSITLIPAYILTHLNVEADYLSWDQLLPEWHLLPEMAQAAFCLWSLPEVDLLASSPPTQCQNYYTLETLLSLGALGLNAFSHPWIFQVSYAFPPPALISLVLSEFLAEHVKGQLRIWFWWHHVGWWLLGFPQFSTCWQMFFGVFPS